MDIYEANCKTKTNKNLQLYLNAYFPWKDIDFLRFPRQSLVKKIKDVEILVILRALLYKVLFGW